MKSTKSSATGTATNLEVGLVLHFGKKRFYRVFFEQPVQATKHAAPVVPVGVTVSVKRFNSVSKKCCLCDGIRLPALLGRVVASR